MRLSVRRTLLALFIVAAVLCAWFVHDGGRYLQHEDPLVKADAIFVLAGARAERWLEAYALYREGYAPLIVVSPGNLEPAEALLHDRGVRFPREVELQTSALRQLGVPPSNVIAPPGTVDNTAQEAELLRDMVQSRGFRTVIVVTSKYHTRRSGFAFRRAMDGTAARIVMRASRYDMSDPARWWRIRADIRNVWSEWQKLLAYRLGAGG